MRRTTTLTALLLGATLLAPTGAASAAGETCRGEAATIVGTGDLVDGTEGRDVIVSGTAYTIAAHGGDDLICVTGAGARSNVLNVDAGPGNDVVDSTAMRSGFYVTAILGDGSDTFVGGAGGDSVRTGTSAGYVQIGDGERDVVDTGDGSDGVVTGVTGAANPDEVRLGAGHDNASWRGTAASGSVLDGGSEHDSLSLVGIGTAYVVDLPTGTTSADGVSQAAFAGFESYNLSNSAGARSIEIVGTEGRDDISFDAAARLVTRLGGGDDSLQAGTPPLADSVIDLGSGQDHLAVRAVERSLELDLEDNTLQVDDRATATVSGVENAFVVARKVRLEGDRVANSLSWRGCIGQVEGGAGKDFLSLSYDPIWETAIDCSRTKVVMEGGKGNDSITGKLHPARILGGPGNDKLFGSSKNDIILGGGGRDALSGKSGNDQLIGGAGRDKAHGSKGRDRCRAEVEKSCER